MRHSISCPPLESRPRIEAMARRAEAAGFRAAWLYDVPGTWMDPYPQLALMAAVTETLHVGPCVSNPVNRDAVSIGLLMSTLHRLSDGRAELALGRGDAAVRQLGRVPASLSTLRAAVSTVRAISQRTQEAPLAVPWVLPAPLPIWIGTYGPRGLFLAGQVADGVILQFTDPELVRWAVSILHEGARDAGRDPGEIRVMVAGPVCITSDVQAGRARVRGFVEMIGGDLAAILQSPAASRLGQELREWGSRWAVAGGDPEHRRGLADAVAERLCLVGPADACRRRLHVLAEAGVDEMNVFTMDDAEEAMEAYSRALVE